MPRTQMERLWLLGGIVAALLLLMIGYFLLISPQNSETDDANSQLSDARARNSVLEAHLNALARENRNIKTYQAAVARARLALPDNSGLPDFLRSLQLLGNETLADVASVTVGDPTVVTPGSTPATPPATTPPATATPGGAQVYALPITADVTGSVKQLDEFLTQLQSVQPRAVLITQITEGNAPNGSTAQGATVVPSGATSLQITMQAFVAPGPGGTPPSTTTGH